MCVTLTIAAVERKVRLDAKELATASGLHVEQRQAGTYELCPHQGCPCDFVGTGKPTDAGWHVRADLQSKLAAAISLAAHRLKKFRLTATWLQEPVSTERAVSVHEMLEIVHEGAIGRASFLVTAA